ncbi:hypothetical protein MN116_002070 [Schistosoma mekongi]|uniref:PH domain-containing protein n=1 Tax=Schistosoma mekongi TaxID=38744 RepID=A0AAE2D822_SCHME|nr:hypothetical protein MN116_002070 [Schistosoma mekongi]
MSTNYSQPNHNDDTNQYGILCNKKQIRTINKSNNKNIINNYHFKCNLLSNPMTLESLDHNVQYNNQLIGLTSCSSDYPLDYTQINITKNTPSDTIINDKKKKLNSAIVAYLHQLELRNQKLEKEKVSLEHQLAHILKRLTSDQNKVCNNKQGNNVNQTEQLFTSDEKNKDQNNAPIAYYDVDDATDLKSLLESNGAISLGEYSSLSDAYEEICLNKITNNDINDTDLSELFNTVEHNETLNIDDDDNNSKCSTRNCIISDRSGNRKHHDEKNESYVDKDRSFLESEKGTKESEGISLFLPDDLLIYRPGSGQHDDDKDDDSESHYNNSSSSFSPSPKSSIKRRTLSSRLKRVMLMHNERRSSSLSVESYNSSSDSIMMVNDHTMHTNNDNQLTIPTQSTSLPVSPITSRNWMSRSKFLKSMKEYTTSSKLSSKINRLLDSKIISTFYSDDKEKFNNQMSNSIIRVSNTSEISTPNTFGSNTSQLPNEKSINSVNKEGPPKVHISRKYLHQPKDYLQFSDTSSSINQIEKNDNISLNHISYTTNNESFTLYNNQSIKYTTEIPQLKKSIQQNTNTTLSISHINQLTYNNSINTLLNKQMITSSSSSTTLPISKNQLFAKSINDFLSTNLQLLFYIDLTYLLFIHEKDQLILKFLLKFIKSYEVFTYNLGYTYLLQNIPLNTTNIIPIVIHYNEILSIDYNQSNEINSTKSLNQLLNTNQLLINSYKINELTNKSIKQLNYLSNKLYNIDTITLKSSLQQINSIESINNLIDLNKNNNNNDNNKLLLLLFNKNYSGVLLKLNNHLKIWHHYWCILTLKGLFLHEYSQSMLIHHQSTNIGEMNQLKKVILYTDIYNIRRPTYSSISINQLGCTQLTKNNSYLLLTTSTVMPNNKNNIIGTRSNVSAPVTRKFVPNENLPKYRVEKYFELVLHNKKVYRLRGITSQETTKWINLIKTMLRINEAEQILNKYKSQIIQEGWLKRVKKGQIAWFWCRLANSYLIYSLNPQSTIPIGCKNLRNTYIDLIGNHASSLERGITKHRNRSYQQVIDIYDQCQMLTSSSDSDSILINLNYSKLNQEQQQTIKIWTPKHEPVYLFCPTIEECEQWRDCLLRASLHSSKLINSINIQKSTLSSSSSSSSSISTSLSSFKLFQIIQKLWRQLVNPSHYNNLYHSTSLIKEPIIKIQLNTEQIQLSLRMFNHLLFLCYPQLNYTHKITLQSINITLNNLMHTSKWLLIKYLIIKQIIQFCYNHPILKDELYLQLIKQLIISNIYTTNSTLKDAYKIIFKTKKFSKYHLNILTTCNKNNNNDNNNNNKIINKTNQYLNQLNNDYNIELGKQYKQSLNEVNIQLTTSYLNKLIIPIININQQDRLDNWWPIIIIWECLCILLTYMLPSESIIECLQYVFMLYMNSIHYITIELNEINTNDKIKINSIQMKKKFFKEISNYATFCYHTLNRIKLYGGREEYPSILEIFTISIRNPYTHVYPFSLPIYLPFGTNYEVVNFHGNSTIYDLQLQIIEKLNLTNIINKNIILFGIYLCVDETINKSKHIYLNSQWKICDIISVYEQFTLENFVTLVPVQKVGSWCIKRPSLNQGEQNCDAYNSNICLSTLVEII